MSKVARQKLEELIGQYWDLGFAEGKTGVNQADAANKVLHDIRELLSSPFERRLVAQLDDVPPYMLEDREGLPTDWSAGFAYRVGFNTCRSMWLAAVQPMAAGPFTRWLVIFDDGGEVVRKTLQDAQQTIEDHGQSGVIVPLEPASSATGVMAAEDAVHVIEALCCYVEGRVAKARKRQYASDSAEIQTAIDRADYVLSHATALAAMLAASEKPSC